MLNHKSGLSGVRMQTRRVNELLFLTRSGLNYSWLSITGFTITNNCSQVTQPYRIALIKIYICEFSPQGTTYMHIAPPGGTELAPGRRQVRAAKLGLWLARPASMNQSVCETRSRHTTGRRVRHSVIWECRGMRWQSAHFDNMTLRRRAD